MTNSYQLPDRVDKNKIFLVNYSDVEDKWNCEFYKLDYQNLINSINNSTWQKVRLEEIFYINRGGSPRPIHEYITANEDGINWIKIGDTKNVDKYIFETKQKIKKDGIKYSRLVHDGDLILSNSMSFGRPYIMKTTGCIHDGWLLLRKKQESINLNFIYCLLQTNFVYKLFKRSAIGGVVDNLNIDLVKKITLPIPDLSTQLKIVLMYDEALLLKQQKEQEAERLLTSIEDYLLDSLGIKIPSKNNSLQSRIFMSNFTDIVCDRFDVLTIKNEIYKIYGGKYVNTLLKDLCYIEKGQSITSANIIEGTYPVIAGGQSSPYSHNQYNYSGDVITISASGAYAGYVWYHDYPIFASDCSVLWIKDNNKLSNQFLFEILKLKQSEIYNLQQGSGQPHVYSSDLKKLLIPLPPLTKDHTKDSEISQEEIVTHISAIRAKAKQLKEYANKDFEATKNKIEQIILHGDML